MYSTSGISHSNFSIGRMARSSTSLALEPGIESSTSIIGTLICGSSSRGNRMIAAAPSSTEVMVIKGVSLESMKARATRPARPGSPLELNCEAILPLLQALAFNQPLWVINDHQISGIEAGKNLRFVIHTPAGFDQVQPGALVLDDEEDLHLTALYDGRGWNAQGSIFARRHEQPRELTGHQSGARLQVELHAKRAADRVGDGRYFNNRA